MARKRQALRCRGTNRAGMPCGNFAVLGAVVCRFHGGGSPQVRQAARTAMSRAAARRALGDARVGPWNGGYGYLPPNRRERALDAQLMAAWQARESDPLGQALRHLVTARR